MDTIPRHVRIALANATRAFDTDDLARLGTILEDLQGLVDAAIRWGRRQGPRPPELTAMLTAIKDHQAALATCGDDDALWNEACRLGDLAHNARREWARAGFPGA